MVEAHNSSEQSSTSIGVGSAVPSMFSSEVREQSVDLFAEQIKKSHETAEQQLDKLDRADISDATKETLTKILETSHSHALKSKQRLEDKHTKNNNSTPDELDNTVTVMPEVVTTVRKQPRLHRRMGSWLVNKVQGTAVSAQTWTAERFRNITRPENMSRNKVIGTTLGIMALAATAVVIYKMQQNGVDGSNLDFSGAADSPTLPSTSPSMAEEAPNIMPMVSSVDPTPQQLDILGSNEFKVMVEQGQIIEQANPGVNIAELEQIKLNQLNLAQMFLDMREQGFDDAQIMQRLQNLLSN